jgi:1,4-alpha-glucan branching enzyme
MRKAGLDVKQIEAIAGGYHRDPFRVLGPHADRAGGWWLRVFLPGAQTVAANFNGQEHPLEPVHAPGFFALRLTGTAVRDYRLAADWGHGRVELDDPYRFPTLLTPFELHLFAEGTHYEAYRTFGAHLMKCQGVDGVRFSVWAPHAEVVSVVGDFNDWDERRHPMRAREGGVWELFVPGLVEGAVYKFAVKQPGGRRVFKTDPFGFQAELPPKTASVVYRAGAYAWSDAEWLERRAATNPLTAPWSVYEVHLESWMRTPEGHCLSYREFATRLVNYVKEMGFTHIELMPIAEYPYSGSWGYQVTGYFAATSRFGSPDDCKYLIDICHQNGIGVIVDWVPGHFPRDAHGLARFDGTACYEHEDPRQGEHKDWGTLIFNYGRNEVKSFLISNALFWLKEYHIDGLRVDAVASMLYLDYSRKEGEWIPNKHGGRENLEAIDFLKKFNELAHEVPGAVTIAEESTSFPGVSRPLYVGGLGFTMKWNMGWMHDMFHYFKLDPIFRRYNHNDVTFSLYYAFTENFLLPVSHDEVVHGKASLIGKMPGDEWRRFANARAFLSYMFAHPGKKLMFMGTEIGQTTEWNYQSQIPWELLQFPIHRGLQTLVREWNHLYQSEPALYEVDFHWDGFEWVDFHDIDSSVISFFRYSAQRASSLLFVCNFTPLVREGYELGLNLDGRYTPVLNSDERRYGGSGVGYRDPVWTERRELHGKPYTLRVTLPPLAVVGFRFEPRAAGTSSVG